MIHKPATSTDVARRAGVSRSTVSHVLNGSNAVTLSGETKRRVKEAAFELGYKPNTAGLMLRNGTTRTVGLLVTEPDSLRTDAYIPLLFAAVGDSLRDAGYHLLLETLAGDSDANPYLDLVVSRRIDGLLVLSPDPNEPGLTSLIERRFPIVLVGSVGHEAEVSVSIRIRESLERAVDHLLSLGHERFGCIPFAPTGYPAADARTSRLRSVLESRGRTLCESAVEAGRFSAESGHQAMVTLIERRPDLTAVFAGNDTIALGAIGGAASRGRAVPHDLSIVGFDDLPFAGSMHPPLTTIRQDAFAQGRRAADLLVALLRGEAMVERRLRFSSEFVVRGSSGPVRVAP